MHIIIYGNKDDHDTCVGCMKNVSELQYRQIRYTHTDNYDGFIEALGRNESGLDLVMVLANGAEGMEGVIAAKNLSPDTAVIWLSDDEGFGVQSYRFGCTFFAAKPITVQMMENAIRKYRQERVGA